MVEVVDVRFVAPAVVAVFACVVVNASYYVEEVCDDELCHAVGAVGGDVCYYDAALFCCVEVNDVVAGGEDADVAELRELCYLFRAEDDLIGKDDVGVFAAFYGEGCWGAVVGNDGVEGFELLPVEVVAGCCEGVEDYDHDRGGDLLGCCWLDGFGGGGYVAPRAQRTKLLNSAANGAGAERKRSKAQAEQERSKSRRERSASGARAGASGAWRHCMGAESAAHVPRPGIEPGTNL